MEAVKLLAKARKDVAGITMDFMQNLPLPNIPVQEVFYFRQLWVNIFNIHSLGDDTSVFYEYHEGLAHKGPNEVCSMVVDYIEKYVSDHVTELYIFSDSCAGQNRNHTFIRLLCALTNRFKKIHYCLPVRGHSFMPNDRNFGVVKKKVKRLDRVYLPKQYVKLIANSFSYGKTVVQRISSEDVLDFKAWWPSFYKKNVISEGTKGANVPRNSKLHFGISSYRYLTFSKDSPGIVKCRSYIDGLNEHIFNLNKRNANLVTLPLERAYDSGKVPINFKKIEDIKKLIRYIPEEHLPFYRDIINWPTTEAERDNDE